MASLSQLCLMALFGGIDCRLLSMSFFLRRCRIKVTIDVVIKDVNVTAASMFYMSVYEVCAVLGVGLGF